MVHGGRHGWVGRDTSYDGTAALVCTPAVSRSGKGSLGGRSATVPPFPRDGEDETGGSGRSRGE
jgi:hypothetical protein